MEYNRSKSRGVGFGILLVVLMLAYLNKEKILAAIKSDTSNSASAHLAIKPALLPVSFVINSRGEVSIQGEASLVTPFGSAAIGVGKTLNPEPGYTVVIIRDFRNTSVFALAIRGVLSRRP